LKRQIVRHIEKLEDNHNVNKETKGKLEKIINNVYEKKIYFRRSKKNSNKKKLKAKIIQTKQQQNLSQQELSQQNLSQQELSQQNLSQQNLSQQNLSQQNLSQQNLSRSLNSLSRRRSSRSSPPQQSPQQQSPQQQLLLQQPLSRSSSKSKIKPKDLSKQLKQFSIFTFNIFEAKPRNKKNLEKYLDETPDEPDLIFTQEHLEKEINSDKYNTLKKCGGDTYNSVGLLYKKNLTDKPIFYKCLESKGGLTGTENRFSIIINYKGLKIANLHLEGGRFVDSHVLTDIDNYLKYKLKLLKMVIEENPDIIVGDFNSYYYLDEEHRIFSQNSQFEWYKGFRKGNLNETEKDNIIKWSEAVWNLLKINKYVTSEKYEMDKTKQDTLKSHSFTNMRGFTIIDTIWYKPTKVKLNNLKIINLYNDNWDNVLIDGKIISDHNPVYANFTIKEDTYSPIVKSSYKQSNSQSIQPISQNSDFNQKEPKIKLKQQIITKIEEKGDNYNYLKPLLDSKFFDEIYMKIYEDKNNELLRKGGKSVFRIEEKKGERMFKYDENNNEEIKLLYSKYKKLRDLSYDGQSYQLIYLLDKRENGFLNFNENTSLFYFKWFLNIITKDNINIFNLTDGDFTEFIKKNGDRKINLKLINKINNFDVFNDFLYALINQITSLLNSFLKYEYKETKLIKKQIIPDIVKEKNKFVYEDIKLDLPSIISDLVRELNNFYDKKLYKNYVSFYEQYIKWSKFYDPKIKFSFSKQFNIGMHKKDIQIDRTFFAYLKGINQSHINKKYNEFKKKYEGEDDDKIKERVKNIYLKYYIESIKEGQDKKLPIIPLPFALREDKFIKLFSIPFRPLMSRHYKTHYDMALEKQKNKNKNKFNKNKLFPYQTATNHLEHNTFHSERLNKINYNIKLLYHVGVFIDLINKIANGANEKLKNMTNLTEDELNEYKTDSLLPYLLFIMVHDSEEIYDPLKTHMYDFNYKHIFNLLLLHVYRYIYCYNDDLFKEINIEFRNKFKTKEMLELTILKLYNHFYKHILKTLQIKNSGDLTKYFTISRDINIYENLDSDPDQKTKLENEEIFNNNINMLDFCLAVYPKVLCHSILMAIKKKEQLYEQAKEDRKKNIKLFSQQFKNKIINLLDTEINELSNTNISLL
jgi:hypothetical protein